MATVSSSKVASTVPAREPHSGVFSMKATYSHPTSGDGSAAGDVIQMLPVAKGTTVLELILTSEDLDSNGAPAIVLTVGDGDDPDRYIDDTTVAQAGGVVRNGQGVAAAAVDGIHYTYTADDTIDIVIGTAAATKAAGTLTLVGIFTMED